MFRLVYRPLFQPGQTYGFIDTGTLPLITHTHHCKIIPVPAALTHIAALLLAFLPAEILAKQDEVERACQPKYRSGDQVGLR